MVELGYVEGFSLIGVELGYYKGFSVIGVEIGVEIIMKGSP